VTGALIRVAAVDCGTNSIRLLVADLDPGAGTLTELDRTMQIVRLGEGVDRTGRLSPGALQRTFASCDEYAARIRELAAERVRFVATSASRDAENSAEFVAGVRARLGVDAEVVDGAEEAALSFAGATRELAGREPGPLLVVDIGGGSTEFVLGDDHPVASRSVDVGCVRITERRLHTDPPTPDEVAAARADIEAAVDLAAAAVPLAGARTLIGLAGSVTTLAAIDAGLTAYDPTVTHHYRLAAASVRELTARLLAMPRAERAQVPVMHPGRVDVIAAGAMVLDAVLTRTGRPEVLVSEHDILDGIAWSLVATDGHGDAWPERSPAAEPARWDSTAGNGLSG
jgi:exopolyphosphatase/guanosine-5'-triphosphate,3'-diphosphate pyrophosphatase